MKFHMFDIATFMSNLADVHHNIEQDEIDPGVYIPEPPPRYMFSKKEQENLVHNWLTGELRSEREFDDLLFVAQAWALTTKATHRKEERTPAQHLSAIIGMLALLGFRTISTAADSAVSEKEAAEYAGLAHKDLTEQALGLANHPIYCNYAERLAHDGHSRVFCDTVARAMVASRFWMHEWKHISYLTASREDSKGFLDRVMKFVALYHDAWGF